MPSQATSPGAGATRKTNRRRSTYSRLSAFSAMASRSPASVCALLLTSGPPEMYAIPVPAPRSRLTRTLARLSGSPARVTTLSTDAFDRFAIIAA